MEILEVKQRRSRAKQEVTTTARRLKNSLCREVDLEALNDLFLDLEMAYDNFCEINEEFEALVFSEEFAEHRVVNGKDLKEYESRVKQVYEEAKVEFSELKTARVQKQTEIQIFPLKAALSRSVIMIKELAIGIKENIGSEHLDMHLLQEDKCELDRLSNEMWDNMSKLGFVGGIEHTHKEEVHEMQRLVCNLKRDIEKSLRSNLGSSVHVSGVQAPTPVHPQSTTGTPVSQPNIYTTGTTAVSYPSVPSIGNPVVLQSSVTNTGYPSGTSPTIPSLSFYDTSRHPPEQVSSQPWSQGQSFSVSGVQASTPVTPSINPQYTTGTPVAQSIIYNTGTTAVSYPSVLSTGNPVVLHLSVRNTGYPSFTRPVIPSPSFYESPRRPPVQVNYGPWSRANNFSGGVTFTSNSDVRLKKISLPVFSGQRKDWPEFKTVWKQLAENTYTNQAALASELKRSVRGEAKERIKSVYVTKPEAYEIMWTKLEAYYDDTSASVQSALDDLSKLTAVKEGDYKGLVHLVDEVECAYAQLEEMKRVDTLTMRDVDFVGDLLPAHSRIEWIRKYHDLSTEDKVHPFSHFMKFLESEREAVSRLAEKQQSKSSTETAKGAGRGKGQTHHSNTTGTPKSKKQYFQCAYPAHRKDTVKHTSEECKEFQKLGVNGKEGKLELLKQVSACFKCFGNHLRSKCPSNQLCSKCGSDKHHVLLCTSVEESDSKPHVEGVSHVSQRNTLALYPIQQVEVCGVNKKVTVFCDSGSDTTYITYQAAQRIKAKKLKTYTLDVTTMGNVEKTYDTAQFQFSLKTVSGKKVEIIAYGMDRITGPVSQLDMRTVSELFPEYDPESLQRKSTSVDILLGCDYFGLHPKKEEARSGDNLSVMSGDFGICLQGTHAKLREETVHDVNLVKTIHDYRISSGSHHVRLDSHEEFHPCVHPCLLETDMAEKEASGLLSTNVTRTDKKLLDLSNTFIQGEELGTETTPRCGGCRCGKCPMVGHTYSFREEQELKMIQENLEYDEDKQQWITSYPWITDPKTLPDNYEIALATLKKMERTLLKDEQWASTYQSQMEDMVERGVARKLSDEEKEGWRGPKFYICHLAVSNPRSQSTPVRIVFNSSQVCHGVSLNSYLAKGPDCYMNNLLGVLLRWREEQVALVGDIKKMFNSVLLKPLEQHCHRFLWRDLKTDSVPDVYVMERVNMGDSPAPAISTEAIYKTADLFQEDSQAAADLLKKSSYVDDLIDSFPSKEDAVKVASEAEAMLAKAGFKVKCWQFSGEPFARKGEDFQQSEAESPRDTRDMLKGTENNLRVLGVGWKPVEDTLVYQVSLNFSKKKKGMHSQPDLVKSEVPKALPVVLTKRMVLGQVMKIYDPLGLVCPFTLIGKVLMRETWTRNIGWDDQLPDDLRCKWSDFFSNMFQLERLEFDRCIQPPDAEGKPWMIILSDGSDLAYGFAAYVRWQLQHGGYSCQLIMAKCRIAPVNKLSTPQMELNAAVLSKRGRKVIEKEMRLNFERVLQVVDSETVLNMINKTSTRFKVYEGVRVGEIQAATEGDMSCWAWMSGKDNTADWLTRGRSPNELHKDSHWWKGPPVLCRPIKEWGLKFGLQHEDPLPGEKRVSVTNVTKMSDADTPLINYKRYSDIDRVIWVVARLRGIAQKKSFSGGRTAVISARDLKEAEDFVVKDIQKSLQSEMMKSSRKGGKGGRYKRLHPSLDKDDFWVIGKRLKNFNAMTPDSRLQKLLPASHRGTRLFMERAHRAGHRGRDATLARFRQYYWVPYGGKLATSVRRNCQLCKLREASFLEQEMGLLPDARLRPAPAFNSVMLDLFGPYKVRGEVQKRTSGKAYGVIFTDLTMRAVHIEAVFGYDTSSFLMALSRFASVRGWPETIYSDPGSQLIGADRELKEHWEKIDRMELQRAAANKGLTWVFGPADSPWNQGAVEALVKSAKRSIHFAVNDQRLSVPEFQTLCSEVSNLLNERPIGNLPSTDSEMNVLTPNSLLLGRATAVNPLGWQPHGLRITTRYHLVQAITDEFWRKWTELYAPTLVVYRKWHTAYRNLKPGDIVIVADKNTLRGEYRLAEVKEVFPGSDGKVRQVTVRYKAYKVGEDVREYSGARDITVSRSVHRLALLVPVDYDPDQEEEEFKKEIELV